MPLRQGLQAGGAWPAHRPRVDFFTDAKQAMCSNRLKPLAHVLFLPVTPSRRQPPAGSPHTPSAQTVHVPAILAHVGAQAHAQLNGRPIALYTTMDPVCPQHLRGDKQQIEQLLHHLVCHALSHTTQGSVTVDVKVRDIHNENVTLRWSVVDTRPGLHAHAPAQDRAAAEPDLAPAAHWLEQQGTCPRQALAPSGATVTWFDLTLPLERRARPAALPANTAVFSNNRRFIDTVATQWAAHSLGLLPRDAHEQALLWVVDTDFPYAGPVLQQAQREGRTALSVSVLPPPASSGDLALAHAATAAVEHQGQLFAPAV